MGLSSFDLAIKRIRAYTLRVQRNGPRRVFSAKELETCNRLWTRELARQTKKLEQAS